MLIANASPCSSIRNPAGPVARSSGGDAGVRGLPRRLLLRPRGDPSGDVLGVASDTWERHRAERELEAESTEEQAGRGVDHAAVLLRPAVLSDDRELDPGEVLLEAGAGLVGAFSRLGLIDEYQLFVAGTFLGSQARPLLDWPLDKMSEAPRLKITEMRAVGDDWRVTAIPLPAPRV